ncbi:GNAT family N-acetyltransferase [Marinobacter sp. SS21]|uniref:GNAT family N-acetyltransferase n=1 Tax=Marinobacter sp. SS21 TaxID=2979460 RepID=UPI00232FF358|nr:GNAT family N-acetyltransferase [Marinobacter sp. SS21]MDC0662075.1 GNAT family N-acetyltransferase [Marinobacter sp. SS21]
MTLFVASVSGLASADYDERQIEAWLSAVGDSQGWRSRLANGMTLVAEVESVIAGFIAFSSQGHVDLLFTLSEFARCGVASHLYRQAEERLRRTGVGVVDTEASKVAQPFFETMGFKTIEKEVVEVAGVALARFRMRKKLSKP